MTDTRLAESFLTNPKTDALSDAGFRVYVLALVWSTTHGTDGFVPGRALRYLHPEGSDQSLVDELVKARLWEPFSGGWNIHDFLTYQTPAALKQQLDEARKQQRAKDAERKRNQRAKKGAGKPTVPKDVPVDVPRDEMGGHTGQQTATDDRDRTAVGKGSSKEEPLYDPFSDTSNGEYRGGRAEPW